MIFITGDLKIFGYLEIFIPRIGDFSKSGDFCKIPGMFANSGDWGFFGDFHPRDFGDGNFSRIGIFCFHAGCDSRTELTFEPTVKILENHSKLRNLR